MSFVCVFSDLSDASITHNAPCSARTVCPNAFVQNLAGCDSATGDCVCQRGYDFDHGLCHGNLRQEALLSQRGRAMLRVCQ